MNYYDLLGVSKNASDKQIKTAFRKLAAKHHPDKGGDHKKFTDLNEAYQVLSDPEKKSMYDQFGTVDPQQAGFSQGFGPGGFTGNGNFQDIFDQMFGENDHPFGDVFGQRQRRPMNQNVRTGLMISLVQAFKGDTVTVGIPMPGGDVRTVEVKVPKGVDHGQTIRLRGLGGNNVRGAPPGDLHVTIQIKDYMGYRREGFDLQKDLTVSVFDLILGTKVEVKHLDDHTYRLNIQAGTQPGTVLSMNGLGMPILNGNGFGNLYVQIKGEIPKNLTAEQKEMITKIRG